MKTKEVIKILEENKLTNIQSPEKYGDFRDDIIDTEEHWWERHKRYIEHRKEFPYDPDKIKNET